MQWVGAPLSSILHRRHAPAFVTRQNLPLKPDLSREAMLDTGGIARMVADRLDTSSLSDLDKIYCKTT